MEELHEQMAYGLVLYRMLFPEKIFVGRSRCKTDGWIWKMEMIFTSVISSRISSLSETSCSPRIALEFSLEFQINL